MILVAVAPAAEVQDRDGAKLVLRQLRGLYPRLKRIWADGGYAGKLIAWTMSLGGWILDIVKRSDSVVGFMVWPKRWTVERTLAWICRYRRMSKDAEMLPERSEAMRYLTRINRMLRCLAPA